MADDQHSTDKQSFPAGADVVIRISRPAYVFDYSTVLGVVLTLGLVIIAISMGDSNASFLDVPSILMVILGTITATSIAFTGDEMRRAMKIIGNSVYRKTWDIEVMARQLLDLSVMARKKGILSFGAIESELAKDEILARAIELVVDGFSGDDIERLLSQEIDSLIERHRRSAGILRRGAEIAPAMGLIGTLVGLVQMLSSLDNPETIGPAMALALLTTFYGAIMGMILLNPLAAKLERNSNDEAMIRTLIMVAMSSIARQENPRRLEMVLNSELPPGRRIQYFQ